MKIQNRIAVLPLLVAVLLVSSSCATPDDSSTGSMNLEFGESIAWFENANPERDALAAAKDSDVRLVALALRGLSVPGVDAALEQEYLDQCGYRLVPGVDDVIRSEEDLRFLMLAREYALAYNLTIISECVLSQ
ncbi:MAG: hypothetical protein GXP15_01640 [Gammaproteobacteria bacterium]|nr:hypothetical protein [Gammaproteobacteria bacterium]